MQVAVEFARLAIAALAWFLLHAAVAGSGLRVALVRRFGEKAYRGAFSLASVASLWWLVYENEYEPIAKKPLELQGLLRFALQRMRAISFEALNEGELSWERYFDVPDA